MLYDLFSLQSVGRLPSVKSLNITFCMVVSLLFKILSGADNFRLVVNQSCKEIGVMKKSREKGVTATHGRKN